MKIWYWGWSTSLLWLFPNSLWVLSSLLWVKCKGTNHAVEKLFLNCSKKVKILFIYKNVMDSVIDCALCLLNIFKSPTASMASTMKTCWGIYENISKPNAQGTDDVVLFHLETCTRFHWIRGFHLCDHPPYFPDFAPTAYHLFPNIKNPVSHSWRRHVCCCLVFFLTSRRNILPIDWKPFTTRGTRVWSARRAILKNKQHFFKISSEYLCQPMNIFADIGMYYEALLFP